MATAVCCCTFALSSNSLFTSSSRIQPVLLCKDPLNPCIDLHFDQIFAPETRSVHLRLAVAYSSSSNFAVATATSFSHFITNTNTRSSFRRATPSLTATSEKCSCCCWNCDTGCWRYVISLSFWLRNGVNHCSFWRSICSRARISCSLAVTVSW